MSDEYVVRGLVRGPHGVEGMVRVSYETDFPERLEEDPRLLVRHRGELREMEVERRQSHKNGLLVKFAGVDDRADAAALRGAQIVVHRNDLPQLEEGVYYWHQLLGLRIETVDGEFVGTIREILQTGSNDVYITEGPLIPAIPDVVEEVDLEAGVMRIRPMPGLLDR